MKPKSYAPLSSIRGRIEHLLITLPVAAEHYVDLYYHEIQSAFKDREQVIRYRNYLPPRNRGRPEVTPVLEEMDLEEQLHAILRGREVLSFVGDSNLFTDYVGDLVEHLTKGSPIANTEWAQDPFCVLEGAGDLTIFLQPLFSRRYMDKFISLMLSADERFDTLVKPTTLLLEGGNILANEDYLLAGKDLLAQNILQILRKKQSREPDPTILESLEAKFRKEFGVREVIWLGFDRAKLDWKRKGTTYQPAFHLDLFLTLGDKNSAGKQVLFFGSPSLAKEVLMEQLPNSEIDFHPAALNYFVEMETVLGRLTHRFEIVKIPLFMVKEHLFSFNNCLVEAFDGHCIAYLPSYLVSPEEDRYERLNPQFRILMEVVESTFMANGFTEVRWIGPGKFFRKLSQMRGSLHCITKVLKRSMVEEGEGGSG